MLQTSVLNNLMLWLIVAAILHAMLANHGPVRMSAIEDALMDSIRILFVVAWIGMLLVQAAILARGPAPEQTPATFDLDAG